MKKQLSFIFLIIPLFLLAQGPQWKHYSKRNTGISDQNITNLNFGPDGEVWVSVKGTSTQGSSSGYSSFNGTKWNAYSDLSFTDLNSVAVDSLNNAWIVGANEIIKNSNGSLQTGSCINCNYTQIGKDGFLYVLLVSFNSATIQKWDLDFNILESHSIGWQVGLYGFEVLSNGNIWLTASNGLHFYNGTAWTTYTTGNSGTPFNDYQSVSVDDNGTIWLGHPSGGVVKFDGNSTWTVYNTGNSTIQSDQIYSVYADSQENKVYIGTFFGLIEFDLGIDFIQYNTDTLFPRGYQVSKIDKNPVTGNIWFISGFVLVEFDGISLKEVYHYMNTGLPNYNSNYAKVKVDPSTGEKWIGNNDAFLTWPGYYDGGLTKFTDSTWTSYYPQNSVVPTYNVTQMIFDKDANLLLGHGPIMRLNKISGWDDLGYTGSLISSMALDSTGNIWIGTGNGLNKFDGVNWTSFTTIDGLSDNVINDVEIDVNNNVWIATNNGLNMFDGNSFTVYNNGVNRIGIGHNGELSVGIGGTVQTFDGTAFNTLGAWSNNINDLEYDMNGNLWIASDLGLIKYDFNTNSFTQFNSPVIPGNSVTDIEINGFEIWITTLSGIAMIDFTPSVAVDAISASAFCPGDTLTVDFNTVGSFFSGNSFTAVLSDAAGNFTSPVNIGSIPGTISGSLTAVIPLNSQIGNGYQIRVNASNPVNVTGVSSASFTIHPLPVVELGNDTAICQGEFVPLNAGNYNSFLWSSGEITANIIVNTSNNIFVYVTDNNGCSAFSDTIGINVNPTPVSNIAANGTLEFCQGDSVSLNAGSGFTSYEWSSAQTSQNLTVTFNGIYFCTLTDNIGCEGVTDTVNVIVNPLPVPVITEQNNILSVATTFVSYQWYKDGVLIAGETSGSHDPLANGDYTIIVTDNYGCENESVIYSYFGSSVTNKEGAKQVKIHPNPASNVIYISSDFQINLIEVYSFTGSMVLNHYDNKYSLSLDVSSLERGVYFAKIYSSEGLISKKLIIH
ncbi:MAG: T9SS type A sorting domain-containing protein [Bacteroidota bacterium]|nr:T9SS type A sorting domain-containing protein [Bacteroidota bacterium]